MDLSALQHEDPILSVLHRAQERIRDPENWCPCGYSNGPTRNWDDPAATTWCAEASLRLETSVLHESDAWNLLRRSSREIYQSSPPTLNDETDHPTVMAMFTRAIELRQADMLATGRVPVAAEATP